MEAGDERVLQEPFLSAPYVHRNNEPKYHAMLLRAVESAKRHESGPQHILWIRAEDVLHNPQEVAATPERVDKKRARFLQFHDQKTAGIPGIFPLHKGMKVRMTEKITKGKKITILKHQSCTVAGWDLHPADRVHEKGCERLLNYFPRVIYLHFEGAKWRIHKDLPLGVFPLKPVKREWTINNETGAKATRQGFTLVPDFASTAFMIQGVTLDAMLAECGDILDHPALAEMVTTYVILSRIKKATGLLLLRAFAPNLFRMGSAPGPHCLLKLLRRRFSTASSDIADYTAADATEEYQSMSTRWESLHKQQKTEGTKWRCFDCQLEFPAQGYTAKSSSRTDILNNCLLPGHWRRCVACTLPADIANDARHQDAAAQRRCQKCNQNRDVRYFDNDSNVCTACELQGQFETLICTTCGQVMCFKDSANESVDMQKPQCLRCAPPTYQMKCQICKEEKDSLAFPTKSRTGEVKITRCKQCAIGCSKCGICISDWRKFATGSSECTTCYYLKKTFSCAVKKCKNQDVPADHFDSDVLFHHRFHKRVLVCLECQTQGYSPKDVKPYECQGGHSCGHLKFESQQLRDSHRATRSAKLVCVDCQAKGIQLRYTCKKCKKQKTPDAYADEVLIDGKVVCKSCKEEEEKKGHHKCDACEVNKPTAEFSHHILKNAQYDDRYKVCLSCTKLGRSPADLKLYRCIGKHSVGHKHFAGTVLANAKRGTAVPICMKCQDMQKEYLKIVEKRMPKCNCKLGLKHKGKKAFLVLHDRMGHDFKCPWAADRKIEERVETALLFLEKLDEGRKAASESGSIEA